MLGLQIEALAALEQPCFAGLLFIDERGADMHAVAKTVATPLVDLPYSQLCPGNDALQKLMGKYR